MEIIAQFLIFSSSIFIIFAIPVQSANSCEPASCNSIHGPEVRFPFRLTNRQPARCGYPGFDLYCNSQNQTILTLPESGEFLVDYIDYKTPALYIDDPDSCLPGRSMNFSLSGSPFQGSYLSKYMFLNCSGNLIDYTTSGNYVPLYCLSERNPVLAMDLRSPVSRVPTTCRRIGDVSVPLAWTFSQFYWWSMDLSEDFELRWSEPACGKCENRGGICGFKGDSGLEIGCSKRSGTSLPRSAKYAIIIGVGAPGLICIIGLVCYIFGIIKTFKLQRSLNSDLPSTTTTIFNQRPIIRTTSGLDGPTIESYPITVLGESRRLPKPSDGTCPICLCEYQPRETLRSIPECNHFFHDGCIDEWLKLNGTCPLCRNSLENSTATIACSSTSLSTSSSSTMSEHQ